MRKIVLTSIALVALTASAAAEHLTEFAKITGAIWTNAAWTADGKHLHRCTASRADDGRQIVFTRDRAGYSLTLTSENLEGVKKPSVRLVVGNAIDETRAMRATDDGSVRISLGKNSRLVSRLTQAIFKGQITEMQVMFDDRTVPLPLGDADGALVELDTCWHNARP